MPHRIITVKCLKDNYCYLKIIGNRLMLIDASEFKPIKSAIQYNFHGKKLEYILITHDHRDHIAALPDLVAEYPEINIIAAKNSQLNCQFNGLEGDAIIDIDGLKIEALFTPGHHARHYCYTTEDIVFVGDLIFGAGCGRAEIGKEKELMQSINRIKSFKNEAKLYFGHEFTLENLNFAKSIEPENEDIASRYNSIIKTNNDTTTPTTLGLELKTNPFFRFEHLLDAAKIIRAKNNEPPILPTAGLDLQVFSTIRSYKNKFSRFN